MGSLKLSAAMILAVAAAAAIGVQGFQFGELAEPRQKRQAVGRSNVQVHSHV
jgi:hypothetical protein